jgi:hypothetical protein
MKSPQFCELCLCECNDAASGKNSVAYISIAEVVSDVAKNKIVTGVRFEAKYGIIFISVRSGSG